ncbi:MAG: four helix bundle protein [bacterium]|nr:four helix bundle protein [bacterium]
MKANNFKENLKKKMDEYVHFVYNVTKEFPKEELYGVISQIRRATLSIILNYIEGYARRRPAVQLNFFEISYGSLKESKYLLHFSLIEKYLNSNDYEIGLKMAEEIGAMLWTEISQLEGSLTHP